MKFILLSFIILGSGCATFMDWLNPKTPAEVTKEETDQEPLTRYSEVTNHAPPSDREYKRMTREVMEEESELHSGAGSLWVMEGQTSYLFAQNKNRKEGDPTTVKVEGAAIKQVQMKADTIKDLLNELEEQKKQAEEKKKKDEAEVLRLADVAKEKEAIVAKGEANNEAAAQLMAEQRVAERKPAAVAAAKPVVEKPKEEKIDLKEVESIPMRITEKLPDGQYRVSGQQYLTIKNRPYKVIATGIVRGDDYNDQLISSEKLYDSQYDIIHMKKGQ